MEQESEGRPQEWTRGLLAFSATAITITFVLLTWMEVLVFTWLLSQSNVVHSAGNLASLMTAPLTLLALGGLGALGSSLLLLTLIRAWAHAKLQAAYIATEPNGLRP